MKPTNEDAQYLAQKRAEAGERKRQAAEIRTVAEWDRRMQRVFKGIMPRPYRISMLKGVQKRVESGELPS